MLQRVPTTARIKDWSAHIDFQYSQHLLFIMVMLDHTNIQNEHVFLATLFGYEYERRDISKHTTTHCNGGGDYGIGWHDDDEGRIVN